MRKSKFTSEQIAYCLTQAEVSAPLALGRISGIVLQKRERSGTPASARAPNNRKNSMPRTKTMASAKYTRRSEEQRIADLQEKIEHLKERAATKTAKKDPTFRYVSKAIKSIDGAMSSTGDQAIRTALQEARATLSACMQLKGILIPHNGRSAGLVDTGAILAFVQKNPGQRAEHIAAGLGTDSKAIRGPMKQLIEERRVKTRGQRRGMQYWAG